MTTIDDFPGAPATAWVSEEGWLIVGDQAWTVDEWRHRKIRRRGLARELGVSAYDPEYKREWMRRHRARQEAS